MQIGLDAQLILKWLGLLGCLGAVYRLLGNIKTFYIEKKERLSQWGFLFLPVSQRSCNSQEFGLDEAHRISCIKNVDNKIFGCIKPKILLKLQR